jgi:hypothetical protein
VGLDRLGDALELDDDDALLDTGLVGLGGGIAPYFENAGPASLA